MHSIDAPSPLFLIEANCRGAGKGLLADTISVIVSGRKFKTQYYDHNSIEMKKTITSLALEGRTFVLLDNIRDKFGNAPLEIATTSTTWEDRILGESRIYSGPLSIIWFATANNAQIVGDMSRRILPIRIHSNAEKPEERNHFKYPDLRKHCQKNRSALLSAGLTILRAWHVAGRPKANLTSWGSYEQWSDIVRQPIVYAGLPDPIHSRSSIANGSDRDEANMQVILSSWNDLDPAGEGLTISQVLDKLKSAESGIDGPRPDWAVNLRDALEEILDSKVNASKLGCCLRAFKGRNFGGLNLVVIGENRNGSNRWAVRPVHKAESAGDANPSPAENLLENKAIFSSAGDAGDVPPQPTPPSGRRSYKSNPLRGVPGLDPEAKGGAM